MKTDMTKTSEERIVYNLFAKIIIIRLIAMVLMMFPAAWKESEIISVETFHALWALGGGIICATAIYGFFVSIRLRVSTYIFADIKTNRLEDNPILYLLNLFLGAVFIAISALFTYANLTSLGS